MSSSTKLPSGPSGKLVHGTVSSYLKQHADNPVDWYRWGDAAFAEVEKQNKPIFLSIGYSTCYWCHIMEDDVFSNESIAEKMNEWFINIKVDREESPEVDEIYMTARQLITQQSGWPNNVFLTPDLKPFYAVGTMSSDGRYGQIPFPELLEKVHHSWTTDHDNVIETAEKAASAISGLVNRSEAESDNELDFSLPGKLFSFMQEHKDEARGGFFDEPKFPHEPYLQFLLDYQRCNKEQGTDIVEDSLDSMALGAVFDHVGGGFHRYTSDAAWRVPHFEKMLYTQALMVLCYAEAYSISAHPSYKGVIEKTLSYVSGDMRDGGGAFYAALDAETNGVEGAYYVWKEEEISSVLSESERQDFFNYYALAELPPVPGHGQPDGCAIYATEHTASIITSNDGAEYKTYRNKSDILLKKLNEHRNGRERPHLDTKIITGWNGLMISAYATAGRVLSKQSYIKQAEEAAGFVLKHIRLENGPLARMYSEGSAHHSAYLEDYSFLISGLLSLYRVDKREDWLNEAMNLIEVADTLFLDEEHGTYFFTDGKSRMITRIRKGSDSVLPSCTGTMIANFLDLHDITGEKKWLERARKKLLAYSGAMREHPEDYTSMVQALMRVQEVS